MDIFFALLICQAVTLSDEAEPDTLSELAPVPIVLDDIKSAGFEKHVVRVRAFPTPG